MPVLSAAVVPQADAMFLRDLMAVDGKAMLQRFVAICRLYAWR